MKYIYSKEPISSAADELAKSLIKQLSNNKRVLWLLSGGSSIPIAISASKKLDGLDLSNLYVSMTDERFGDIGHTDENWQQLIDGGLKLPGANLYRPLIGQDIAKTSQKMNEWLNEQLKKADYKIAIFGMGADGHTCGIKPGSPAVTSDQLVSGFMGDDFMRITITFNVISKIDEAIIQASGSSKKAILHDLINYDTLPSVQPAQILKTIPKSTIFTDNKRRIYK